MGKRDKQDAISRAVSVTESSDTLRSICEDSSILRPYVTSGLGAFANNDRKKIKVPSTSLLNCSVNLDEASRMSHPHENRWDYALDYAGKAFFIEIHPAHTSEIECMVKKVLFIKKWLTSIAPEILRLPGTREFYWVSSGTTDLRIMKNSPQARKLALHRIVSVGQTWDYWKSVQITKTNIYKNYNLKQMDDLLNKDQEIFVYEKGFCSSYSFYGVLPFD